jgi:uridine monophosphate synthetase
MAVLQEVIRAVPEGIPVILDAKRADIASTAEAYARAVFQAFEADAVTVSPYLGFDSLEPFLRDPQRGVFLLCKTSNPGSADLQDLALMGWSGRSQAEKPRTVYEAVAAAAQGWNQMDNLGLVVGATFPQALERVRAFAPSLWIMAPGVGAQGGELEAALRAGLRADGLGLLIPVSRAISRAANPGRAADDLRAQINQLRAEILAQSGKAALSVTGLPPGLAELAESLLQAGCVRFGRFTLKSGLESPIYLDLRQLISFPRLLDQAAEAYLPLLERLLFDRLAALPYAALPIATAISLKSGWSMIYPRKESKAYGTRVEIEGNFVAGQTAVLIDDLATTGGSKFEAIEKLSAAGLVVKDVVVLVDRQSGAASGLAQKGFHLHCVFTLSQLLDHWELRRRIPDEQIAAVRQFLSSSAAES